MKFSSSLVIKTLVVFSLGILSVESCVAQPGYCVTAEGKDQNEGVIKISSVSNKTLAYQNICLKLCTRTPNVTGCELIWGQANRGCYAHTKSIAKGNGQDRHMCWILSECRGNNHFIQFHFNIRDSFYLERQLIFVIGLFPGCASLPVSFFALSLFSYLPMLCIVFKA